MLNGSSLAAASVGDVELGVPYGAWESPEIEEIAVPTDFAESAMPSHKGLKTIVVGLVLLLLFLTLTEWRVKGSQKNGSLLSRIQDAQDSTAALLNSPVQELNAHLERDGKAMSVRLLLFMTFIICLFIGTMELAFSLGRRYTQRASFPVLKRAQVVGTFAALMIFLSLLGIFGTWTMLLEGNSIVSRVYCSSSSDSTTSAFPAAAAGDLCLRRSPVSRQKRGKDTPTTSYCTSNPQQCYPQGLTNSAASARAAAIGAGAAAAAAATATAKAVVVPVGAATASGLSPHTVVRLRATGGTFCIFKRLNGCAS
ncbi:hypothetical protein EAH_00032050 [Eimeria acervulina]|uniref:Uncharacterized protein n=1 Tax=Eimeria acervulina TaxID=5801 RepID=U6GFF8_EIMAC|nr:hypothetical protein EAH_00032050 [Eimeria acervulina]CDI78292.1 hypothetical protein EAH_00032050 [Eimeria acervulina]